MKHSVQSASILLLVLSRRYGDSDARVLVLDYRRMREFDLVLAFYGGLVGLIFSHSHQTSAPTNSKTPDVTIFRFPPFQGSSTEFKVKSKRGQYYMYNIRSLFSRMEAEPRASYFACATG